MPKFGRLIGTLLTAAAITTLPATAHAQARPFQYPTATFKLSRTVIHKPGSLTATVTVSTCITGLTGWAEADTSMAGVKDTVTGKPGRVYTLRFAFHRDAPVGAWALGDMFGQVCGKHGWTEIDPAKGYFPGFRVEQ